jgi:methylthioribose-1-phosphate isomerase
MLCPPPALAAPSARPTPLDADAQQERRSANSTEISRRRGIPHNLKPSATSTKQKVKNDQQNNQVEGAAAIVAKPGAHVIAAAANKEKKKDEDDKHARKSSTPYATLSDPQFTTLPFRKSSAIEFSPAFSSTASSHTSAWLL